jgi:undecaprenyl-diphosphatase
VKNLDKDLFLSFNQSGSESWDFFWTLLTDKYLAIPVFALLLLIVLLKYKFKTAFVVGVFMVALIGVTYVFSSVVKSTVQRPRPCSINSPIKDEVRIVSDGVFGNLTTSNVEKCEKFSFFSSHAAVSFALALFFGLIISKIASVWLFVLIIWATLVSISRIYLGFHYPSDILVGAIVGGVFGYAFYRLILFGQKYTNHALPLKK